MVLKGRYNGKTASTAPTIMDLHYSAIIHSSRIKRGTLRSVKEGSTVYVLLDADQAPPEQSPDTDQTAARSPSDSSALISHLQDEIAYLREENRRKDHIIAGLVERIPPALEPPGARERDAEASEGTTRSPAAGDEAQEAAERPRGEARRSWWREFFGIGE